MDDYGVPLSQYIISLNQSISRQHETKRHEAFTSSREIDNIFRKRARLRKSLDHPEPVAIVRQRIRSNYKHLDNSIIAFFLVLAETIPEGEIVLSGDLQILQLTTDGTCERVERMAFEIGILRELSSSAQSLEDFVEILSQNMDSSQWFTLELFVTDEKGPVTVHPKQHTVNTVLRSFMDIISKHYKDDVTVMKVSDTFVPTKQRESTVAVHNYDQNEMIESTALLDILRRQRHLAPARVIDNFRKANIYDQKRNVVLIGLTKSRKSGTANDIISFLSSDAPRMVFLEERAFSHTNKVRCFETEHVRVWDTPGLDDQVGRGTVFIKKVCNLMDSLSQVNAVYLCLKDSSELSPNLLAPVREVIEFLPSSVRHRVCIAFTKSDKLESIDRLAVRMNAHHAGLNADVQMCQATRNACDYSLHEKIQADVSLPPVRGGYLARTLEAFEKLRKPGSDLAGSINREVKLSLSRLEERIRLSSSLNSTHGVVFSLKRAHIEVKSYSRVIHNPKSIPRGAKVELVVFLLSEKRLSGFDLMKHKLRGDGTYEKLEKYIVQNELVLLDRVHEAGRFESLFSSSEKCVMVMVQMREVITKNLLNDVDQAVHYFSDRSADAAGSE